MNNRYLRFLIHNYNLNKFANGKDTLYLDEPVDYMQAAEMERQRQWNMAKSYMRQPTIPNAINALMAAYRSLPFVTTQTTVNPYASTGIAPTPGKISYTPEQMSKYWAKLGAQHAALKKLPTLQGPNGKMYVKTIDGKLRSFESIGKELQGGVTVEYTPKSFKPVKQTLTEKPSGSSIYNKPRRGRVYNTNAIDASYFE